ncbi:MAG: serine/threonine protein kinase [candidate division WOR-3 bacterium]|nr:serine/threonine protein kinase [candidate division WOR-3 bacterium]MCX7946989.1 serine/threonine protein kinase [candidate division WOR-3 bacterium]MDW8149970.1 serine/threonine-protein kinase [candidate division WOR-3 bacterium]
MIGTVIADKYKITRKIASGGMAEVYEAIQPIVRRKVAIKILYPQYSKDEKARELFFREARIVAQELEHPNIVKVYDFGIIDDNLYLVMYYVSGETLERIIKREGKLDIKEACYIVLEVLKALDYAHQKNIIHRDIKPGNIMITPEKRVYLLDFGIAALLTEDREKGRVPGTPEYMSPEQFRGKIDKRSDLYSLGVVLYETLTGQLPFKGNDIWELQRKIFTEPPIPPSHHNPNVPKSLDDIVLKALNKIPSERFQTAYEFANAILDTNIIENYYIEFKKTDVKNEVIRGGIVQEEETEKGKKTQFVPISDDSETEFEFIEEKTKFNKNIIILVILGILVLGGFLWFLLFSR